MDKEFWVGILSASLDCIEECLDTTIVVTEKRLWKMLIVCCCFLGFSVIAKIVDIPVFITWQIPLIACIMLGIILSINKWNMSTVNKFKKKLGGLKDGTRK